MTVKMSSAVLCTSGMTGADGMTTTVTNLSVSSVKDVSTLRIKEPPLLHDGNRGVSLHAASLDQVATSTGYASPFKMVSIRFGWFCDFCIAIFAVSVDCFISGPLSYGSPVLVLNCVS